jgi:NAD(P)H dehydrogenase (quinone)
MPKLLIIYAHPNHEGSNGFFLKTILEKLEKKDFSDYEVIDLYQINYDPRLKSNELYSMGYKEISEENLIFQEKIKSADKLLFIYPTWWQNMPAILKGFLDRVFTSGFAFKYILGAPIGLLKGKRAAIFTATGGPALYNKLIIRNQAIKLLSKHVLLMAGIVSKGFTLSLANRFKEKHKNKITKIADRVINYLDI